jgi:FMN-dependent NADH-azoreductase
MWPKSYDVARKHPSGDRGRKRVGDTEVEAASVEEAQTFLRRVLQLRQAPLLQGEMQASTSIALIALTHQRHLVWRALGPSAAVRSDSLAPPSDLDSAICPNRRRIFRDRMNASILLETQYILEHSTHNIMRIAPVNGMAAARPKVPAGAPVCCIQSTVAFWGNIARKERSASIEVANAFLDTLRTENPDTRIDVLDLWAHQLPEFYGPALQAKYAGLEGVERTTAQQEAWDAINVIGDRIKAVDLLLFAIPMSNWGIPYKLKHLIDFVSQKDVLFTFDERGLNGLLTEHRAVCIYARGIAYGADTDLASWDQQRPFMETWLASVGVPTIDTVLVEKTLLGPDVDEQARDAAKKAAQALARTIARR